MNIGVVLGILAVLAVFMWGYMSRPIWEDVCDNVFEFGYTEEQCIEYIDYQLLKQ